MSNEQIAQTIDVKLEFLDPEGNIIGNEHTVTDAIMQNGARVFAYSNVPVGEFLVFKTADGRFESPAIVKAVQVGADLIPRLLLEFTGADWQQKWVYAGQKESPDLYYENLRNNSRETSMLLQIIITDLEGGQAPDQVFLSELKAAVDELRTNIFRLQKILTGEMRI
jgi:hypothetical protein